MPKGYPRVPRPPRDYAAEIAARTERDPITGCLLWKPLPNRGRPRYGKETAHPNYPSLWIGGKAVLVSHIVLELAGKPVPKGQLALHTCDRPQCVELDHLFAGTQSQNVRDAVAKNRWNHGGSTPGGRIGARRPPPAV